VFFFNPETDVASVVAGGLLAVPSQLLCVNWRTNLVRRWGWTCLTVRL